MAGLLAGVIIASVLGAHAKTTFLQMVNGQPAKAADVNQAHQDLADAIDKLQAEIATLKMAPDCPPGYTRDSSATTITLCKRGADEMVKVGSYWIDRYEASLVDATLWAGAMCNGAGGKQYGAGVDDLPQSFPDDGAATAPLYSCSVKGNKPASVLTWFQAAAACEFAGKRLCTNYQWQVAATGTPDAAASCNTSGGVAATTGSMSKCVSRWGALDMVGNLPEWADGWMVTGQPWATGDGQAASPWGSKGGFGDGKDGTWNLNGTAHDGTGWVKGLPSVPLRSGRFDYGQYAGAYTLFMNHGPQAPAGGARCCLEQS